MTIKDDGGSTASTTSTATVDPVAEKPVLGGATSASVHMGGLITLGVTETPFDSDDTLGNVTITGLPHDLSDFNGGTYICQQRHLDRHGGAVQCASVRRRARDWHLHALDLSAEHYARRNCDGD